MTISHEECGTWSVTIHNNQWSNLTLGMLVTLNTKQTALYFSCNSSYYQKLIPLFPVTSTDTQDFTSWILYVGIFCIIRNDFVERTDKGTWLHAGNDQAWN